MSMSIPRRQDACLHFIHNGFDADQTIAWMLTEYREEPTVLRAKHPEKLCRNIITMGGSGIEKEANIAAFNRALDVHAAQERDREAAATRQKMAELEGDLRTARDRAEVAQAEVNKRQLQIDNLRQQNDDLTRRNHQHELTAAKEPAAV